MKKNTILYYLTVALIIFFSVAPILWCFIISITPESDIMKNNYHIFPSNIILENYRILFDNSSKEHITAFNGLISSIKISFLTLILGIPISVITSYILVRYEFKFKKIFINILLITIVIPVFTTIIPIYSIFRNLNLIDSQFWTSIIYISSFLPLNIWMIINYLNTLPKELWYAASLDGFNEIQIFTKIVIPISTPAIITSILIMFLMAWKQYVIPMILISSYNYKPITLVMSEFMNRYEINYGIISAVGIISIIPPALIAIIFRKLLISGLTSGTLKN